MITPKTPAEILEEEEWNKIIGCLHELMEWFPEGMILIGGVAVYLHAKHKQMDDLLEASHDADMYLSMSDYIDLRDIEEVTQNKRLNKHQIIKEDIDIDIYVENQHSLAIPFYDISAHSVVVNGLRIACLEHLLILKVDAAMDRRGEKKKKDNRDLAKIILLLDKPDNNILDQWLTNDRLEYIFSLKRKTDLFLEIAKGNAHTAKQLAVQYSKNLGLITLNNEDLESKRKNRSPGDPSYK